MTIAVRVYVKKNVLGLPDHVPQGPLRKGHNIAETAPDMWKFLKERRERKAEEKAREESMNKGKW